VVTKSSGIERDVDILASMAARRLVLASISVTSLDAGLSRRLEPRAAAPRRRLKTIERLASAGIPVGVIVAPVIPFLNDDAIEGILKAAADAGARHAHYILIRLPLEVSPLFHEWLLQHYPDRAARIMNRIRDMRGGADYRSEYGARQRGEGVYAALIARRFAAARERLGFVPEDALDCASFHVPGQSEQLSLF
jgi:DNA repair photolyase